MIANISRKTLWSISTIFLVNIQYYKKFDLKKKMKLVMTLLINSQYLNKPYKSWQHNRRHHHHHHHSSLPSNNHFPPPYEALRAPTIVYENWAYTDRSARVAFAKSVRLDSQSVVCEQPTWERFHVSIHI